MNRVLFVLVFFCSLVFRLQAQDTELFSDKEDQNMFESGKSLFEEKLYHLAYEHFNTLLSRHPGDLFLKYLTGICGIYISNKHEEALARLGEVKSKNPKAADMDYYIALLYHRTYRFDECIELANRLLQKTKLDPQLKTRLEQVIEHSENGKELATRQGSTRVANLGAPVNTEDDEYSPVISPDEQTLLYTYRGKLCKGGLRDIYDRPNKYGFYYEDIYMSKKLNGFWQPPVSLEQINTESNEAALAISNDGQELFIFRASETDGGDIYRSLLKGDEFGTPEKLNGDINTESWEGSITLSGDGKKVIFASDRPGGLGGKDLYQAVKIADNTYGHVKNLGDHINTAFDEDAPFLHPDGRSLVFSSEGHNSIGDYDIFLSELDESDSSWKKPVNVGYPINTTGDDIFYTLSADGKRGYFASSKDGGLGDKDIYVEEPVIFSKNSYLTIVKGSITENKQPYAGGINVFTGADMHGYASFKSNAGNGRFSLSLPAGKNYKIVFSHPQYGDKVVDLAMDKNADYSELNMDIHFGEEDSSPAQQNVVARQREPVIPATPQGSVSSTPLTVNNNTTVAEDTKNSPSDNLNNDLQKMSRAQLLAAFGKLEVPGLKYLVQVGAYRHPENYNNLKFQKLCHVVRQGVIQGNVNLLIADKEFKTWNEAEAFLGEVKMAGQKDAFLTANYNGKRCYMKDLVEMRVWMNTGLLGMR